MTLFPRVLICLSFDFHSRFSTLSCASAVAAALLHPPAHAVRAGAGAGAGVASTPFRAAAGCRASLIESMPLNATILDGIGTVVVVVVVVFVFVEV